jgi:hypothetical protein
MSLFSKYAAVLPIVLGVMTGCASSSSGTPAAFGPTAPGGLGVLGASSVPHEDDARRELPTAPLKPLAAPPAQKIALPARRIGFALPRPATRRFLDN